MSKVRYQKQWKIPSNSNPDKTYTVSLTMDGKYICHCWPFLNTRKECNHIILAKSGHYDSIDPPNAEERANALLQGYAEKGYRYYTWFMEPMQRWDRETLEIIKKHPHTISVKTFATQGRRIVVLKESEAAYQAAIAKFTQEIGKYDFRRVKNKDEVKTQLRKQYFELCQRVIFNSTGVINPNLPDGSVTTKGTYGRQLQRLKGQYKWL